MFLRDVLKRGKSSPNGAGGGNLPLSSKRNIKGYASSVKSAGMRSIAESMSSFYSSLTGSGPRVPKRRRADYSTLGVPEWYADDPPPLQTMPGTADPPEMPPFSMTHSSVMHSTNAGVGPWLGVVLYSHAPATVPVPMYHPGDKIAGEVHMVLDKSKNLNSIDVWFVLKSDSVVDTLKPPILTMTANLWNRKKGDPSAIASDAGHFKGKFPQGTFVFPFEFPALPTDAVVKHPDEERRKNKGRVPLPPTYRLAMVGSFSGNIQYIIGVNVSRDGIGAIDEEFDVDLQYLPIARPLPRAKTPFPFLPTREDWPFAREVVGGWTLTPFGGRGRLGEDIIELGIQEPAVYTAGQTIEFSLMLWSANPLVLEALAQPGAIEVGYYKSDIFSLDALNPKKSSRKNRRLERLNQGRVWLTEGGKPADDEPMPECTLVKLPKPSSGPKSSVSPVATSRFKTAPQSRMQQVWTADFEDANDATAASDANEAGLAKKDDYEPPPSPTPSFEGLDDLPDPDRVIRLDGEVRVPTCSHPSFRFSNMSREYVLHLLIKHPQYSHISPAATGIVAEVPVWYVLNRFANVAPGALQVDRATLPVKGEVIPMGDNAVRLPASQGHATTQQRPTFRVQRVAAF
ncbi:hypothetical protein C8R45DRAFT_244990 [Mycena sanguinolenta]|nr:hypothetical protein C8R45DRAFT_244990 [Mycena sanguinolenta]